MTPDFAKKRINLAEVTKLQQTLRAAGLNTVCEGAKCPNIGECFERKVATFLIAGNVCTRNCRFCAIASDKPLPLDRNEPERVAKTVKELGLRYAVVTSVTRDDLADGGATHFCYTVAAIRDLCPGTAVEILVPDFKGDKDAWQTAFSSRPEVFSHNLETVPRLYPHVRPGAIYRRSLDLIAAAKQAELTTKSGLMLGLGETEQDVVAVMDDLRAAGCDLLTLGQYLAPSLRHIPVAEFIHPDQFKRYKDLALQRGFKHCASHTYVRSSYRADEALHA